MSSRLRAAKQFFVNAMRAVRVADWMRKIRPNVSAELLSSVWTWQERASTIAIAEDRAIATPSPTNLETASAA